MNTQQQNRAAAFHAFWNSFTIPAYEESTVPNYNGGTAALPYITYNAVDGDIDHPMQLTASIWYRDASWEAIENKAAEIREAIGYGGKVVPCLGGAMWIKRGDPFGQRMAEPSDAGIRRIVLTVEVDYFIM